METLQHYSDYSLEDALLEANQGNPDRLQEAMDARIALKQYQRQIEAALDKLNTRILLSLDEDSPEVELHGYKFKRMEKKSYPDSAFSADLQQAMATLKSRRKFEIQTGIVEPATTVYLQMVSVKE